MSISNEDTILAPFLQSRQSRHAHLHRTHALLSTLNNNNNNNSNHHTPSQPHTLLTLPNNNINDNNASSSSTSTFPITRPSSSYILRSPSAIELTTLLDPQQCNCRLANKHVSLLLMYRVAGNGEGASMSKWDVSSSLRDQVRNSVFGGDWLILGILLDGPDAAYTVGSGNSVGNSVGNSGGESSLSTMPGITNNSLLQNSIFEPGCSIHNNSEISHTHVMKHASIIGCGSVTCPKTVVEGSKTKCNFDMVNGSMDVEVGPEAGGGRVVNVKVESTMVDVCHALAMDSGGSYGSVPLVPPPETTSAITSPAATLPTMNILCPHSTLQHTPSTQHIHLSPHSTIHSATSITSALLLPHSSITNSVTASHALLQWSAALTSHSDAHHVFLMEKSVVGPHSFTANAIYGPDAHVSGGEVHCTIFGPNANSHHQSLLIGILWPLGRGNVGYGSNVGSNHTGRIPDQETSVGEGTFWGLGSVIKFPVDLTSAPYSIIAAGVQLPPQRITLPFSLITDGPGGMNQLTPGWLLQYSPYTIARSEVKFANRRTAKRHDFYTGWKILREGMVDMLVDARNSLVHAGKQQQPQVGGEGSSPKKAVVYKTDKAIPGLGANQLTEKGRQIGIRAYTDAIQRYALRGLLERLLVTLAKNQSGGGLTINEILGHVGLDGVQGGSSSAEKEATPSQTVVNWPVLPWNEASHSNFEALWKHQHSILLNELPTILRSSNTNSNTSASILSTLLQKCIALEDDHSKRVYQSKSRDDSRGASTVPGYKDAHVAAEKDAVVLASKEEADRVKGKVQLIEKALCGGGSAARSRL